VPGVVPRIVFGTAFIGVVPACVVAACTGGSDSTGTSSSSSSSGYGVAAVGYACFDANDPNCRQGVAAVAFQCFDGSTSPNCNFAVADAAFGSDADASHDGDADGAG